MLLKRFFVLASLFTLGFCPTLASQVQNAGWPTNGYTLANTRHVDFSEINAKTVHQLALAWKYRVGEYGVLETTPIVAGNTMYLTTGTTDSVIALDARSGDLKWRYQPTVGKVPPI